jgi:hypothetical protein
VLTDPTTERTAHAQKPCDEHGEQRGFSEHSRHRCTPRHGEAWSPGGDPRRHRLIPALDADGEVRDGAEICEITDRLPSDWRAGYPEGTRFIVRRERPHPGGQLTLFDTLEGMRHQVMATDTGIGGGSVQYLEARHRGHARV